MVTFTAETSIPAQSGNSGPSDEDKAKRAEIREAVQKATIEAAGTATKARTLVGYISGFISLGVQPRGEFEDEYDENDPAQKKKLEEVEGVFVEERWNNDKKCRMPMLCTPRPPAQAFIFTVDFPSITVDKGKFYGASNPAPLRMYMMREFWAKKLEGEGKEPIIQSPFFRTQSTQNSHNAWAYGTTTTVHKMADAAGVLDERGLFEDKNIGQLFCKPMMFKIQIWNKPNKKDPSKTWFTEDIKFAGEIPEGLPVPEWDKDLFFGININKANDPECLNQLRQGAVRNTIKRAVGYEDSIIKKEFDADYEAWKAKNGVGAPAAEEKTVTPHVVEEASDPAIDALVNDSVADGFDDSVPF